MISAVGSGAGASVAPRVQAVSQTNDGDADDKVGAAGASGARDGDNDDRSAVSTAMSRSSSAVQAALIGLASDQ